MTMTSIRRFLTTRVHVPAAICLSMMTAASLSLFAFATTDEPQQKPAGGVTSTATASGEKITVAFTDPSRPGKLTVSLMQGKIFVKGHDANNVIVETVTGDDDDEDRQERGKRAGLRRIRN